MSGSGWQRAVPSVFRNQTCCLSCPWPACQTQCSGCIKIRGVGSLGLDKWASRAHGVQKYCPSPSLLDCRKHLQESLDLQNHRSRPSGMRALSLFASASACSSLPVSLSLSTAAGRNPVQKLNAHLAAGHPHPPGGAGQQAQSVRPSQVRSCRKQVSQGWSGAERRKEMAGARSTRASDGMGCRSYCTRYGVRCWGAGSLDLITLPW